MTNNNLKERFLNTEHGVFTPLYTYTDIQAIKDVNGAITDYELVDYVETATAEEVYQKYLSDKANPPTPEPTETEKLQQQLDAILLALVEV